MLEIHNLCKQYADYQALQGLNLQAKQGEIIGLLGPNGSGKSTTLKILAGILTPTLGEIKWKGESVITNSLSFRKKLAYVPEKSAIYPELNVSEYLNFMFRLAGNSKAEAKLKLEQAIEKFQLASVAKKLCANLSKGYQQRLMLAQALMRSPELLLLDEPNTGLDPVQIRELIDLLTAEAPKMIIILSSHQLREVELLCSRVIGISKGHKIFDQVLPKEHGERVDLETLYQQTI